MLPYFQKANIYQHSKGSRSSFHRLSASFNHLSSRECHFHIFSVRWNQQFLFLVTQFDYFRVLYIVPGNQIACYYYYKVHTQMISKQGNDKVNIPMISSVPCWIWMASWNDNRKLHRCDFKIFQDGLSVVAARATVVTLYFPYVVWCPLVLAFHLILVKS